MAVYLTADTAEGMSQSLQALFDQNEREMGDKFYWGMLNPQWRTLSPAELKAEARRVLGFLSPEDGNNLWDAVACLTHCVQCKALRELFLAEGLLRKLPPLMELRMAGSVHWTWVSMLSELLQKVMLPEMLEVQDKLWSGKALPRFVFGGLQELLSAPGQAMLLLRQAKSERSEGEPRSIECMELRAAVVLTELLVFAVRSTQYGLEGLANGLGMSQDEAKSLVVKGCSIMIMARPRQMDTFVEILRPLRVVGVSGSGVDAMQCLLNRDMEAREVFLASGCLPQLVTEFKANEGTRYFRTATYYFLSGIAGSCSGVLMQQGLISYLMQILGNPPKWGAQCHLAASLLLMLCDYGDEQMCTAAWRTGLFRVLIIYLDVLIEHCTVADTRKLKAALAVAETVDELFKCSARVMRKCQGWQEEALELKLPSKMVDAANAMLAAVRDAGEWAPFQRQMSIVLSLLVCDAKMTNAMIDAGLLECVATCFPLAHPTAAINFVSTWNCALAHATDRCNEIFEREGVMGCFHTPPVPAANMLQRFVSSMIQLNKSDPPRRPTLPQQQLCMVAALGTLATMKVLDGGKPSCKELEAAFKSFRNRGPIHPLHPGPTCCVCCALGTAPGISLKQCSGCKKRSYCGTECQRRDWKLGHKQECRKS